MSTLKPTIWLVACGVLMITCYGRQGTQCLAAKSNLVSSEMAGVANEDPFLVGLLQQLEDREHHQRQRQQQQQQQLQLQQEQEQHAKAVDDNDHWQSKRLRLDEPDTDGTINSGFNQLTAKESMRRLRIDQLLEALSGSIPSATTPKPRVAQITRPANDAEPQLAPIYRSGRTFPAGGVDLLGGSSASMHQRNQQFAGRSFGARERWQSSSSTSGNNNNNINNMLDGRTSSRNANLQGQYGLVWPASQNGASNSGRYQSKPRSVAAIATNKIPRSFAIDEPEQPINELYRPNEMGSARKSHRSGSEEFAIPTPVHSQTAGDYETKRVENSRGWNTLRGMWGKRSANRASPIDDDGQLHAASSRDDNAELGHQTALMMNDATAQSIRLSM